MTLPSFYARAELQVSLNITEILFFWSYQMAALEATFLTFSTGGSKGAVHTHESTLAFIISFSIMDWMKKKPNLLLSKGTHISGMGLPLSCLAKGGTSLVMSRITKHNFYSSIQKYKVCWNHATSLCISWELIEKWFS